MTPIYLDYAATAPLEPEVLDAMMPWLRGGFGNPSSVHSSGRTARHAVEQARTSVAELIGALPEEIVFTSGGTEANNMAIIGWEGPHVVTSAVEHDAVLVPVRSFAQGSKRSAEVLVPDASGRVAAGGLDRHLSDGTLASFMLVNNELGTINPVSALAARCHAAGARLHCDGVQGPAFRDLNVDDLGVDMLTLSAHKIGGPKGVGLLYVRSGTALKSLTPGGGQERNRRGGTENVAGIVGFAAAMRRQYGLGERRTDRLYALNATLRNNLSDRLADDIRFNSPEDGVAPHILNVGVPGVPAQAGGEMLILGLDMEGVQTSAGSACSSGALNASHVLEAIERGHDSAIRFSLGYHTTDSELERAVEATSRVVDRVKAAL